MLGCLLQEEGHAIVLSIIRKGGALVTRSVEYSIIPNGADEFYGSTNVVRFEQGEVRKEITVLAKGDGIPEVSAGGSPENGRDVLSRTF